MRAAGAARGQREVDSRALENAASHVTRWDLDKTYLRTEFDSMRDLVRTAFERPDEKRTHAGAGTLLREMARAGALVHILSGSPEQMRRRLESKLRLDGITWDAFTLKPNLENMLRLRFRALRDQLGYKLPNLLDARAHAIPSRPAGPMDDTTPPKPGRETLFGDDAEADAFVYSLYADVVSGHVPERVLMEICERGRVYADVAESVRRNARIVEHVEAVERILIHLERQTPPDRFRVYGVRVVPFYNYLQAAFVVHEDGRVPAEGVLRVALELVVQHRFDGDSLARSYQDVARRGHLRGIGIDALHRAYEELATLGLPGMDEVARMLERLPTLSTMAKASWVGADQRLPDYLSLVELHNPRR